MAQLIDGKVISAQIKDEVKEKVAVAGRDRRKSQDKPRRRRKAGARQKKKSG